ncbi:MAG: lysophospholipid acyltransferase family protein [Pseudomonadota bacterium]
MTDIPPCSPRRRKRPPKLHHRPLAVATISATAATGLRGVFGSCRISAAFHPEALALLTARNTGIGVFWHQRLLGIPALWRVFCRAAGHDWLSVSAMVSHHGDGELIARTLERLGVDQVRGSTRRGAVAAARRAGAAMADGAYLAIVVDGPTGPHARVQPGALFLAKRSGRPIVPITFATSRGWQAGSWDRLLVPLPLAKVRFVADAPIWIPDDTDAEALDAHRLALEERLRQLNRAADEAVGIVRT